MYCMCARAASRRDCPVSECRLSGTGQTPVAFSVPLNLGGQTMQDYRAYIPGPDGHIQNRVDIVCEDDEAAKERAKQLVDGHDVELWQSARHIATFKQG